MNIGTDGASKNPGAGARSAAHAGAQLSLPLELDSRNEDALRAAWKRSGLPMPYHIALRNRPLAICLSCLADTMRRKAGTDGRGAGAQRRSKRVRRSCIG